VRRGEEKTGQLEILVIVTMMEGTVAGRKGGAMESRREGSGRPIDNLGMRERRCERVKKGEEEERNRLGRRGEEICSESLRSFYHDEKGRPYAHLFLTESWGMVMRGGKAGVRVLAKSGGGGPPGFTATALQG
jgi:hypothetical protein